MNCPFTIRNLAAGTWPLSGYWCNEGIECGWTPISPDVASAALFEMYNRGVRLFDTAFIYGGGAACSALSTLVQAVNREEICIAAKVGYERCRTTHGMTRAALYQQFDNTCKALGTDYLDILQLHHSDFGINDCYIDEAVSVVKNLLATGRVRRVGIRAFHRYSLDPKAVAPNWNRVRYLIETFSARVISVAINPFTIFENDELKEMVAYCDETGVDIFANKTLAQGLLCLDFENPVKRFGPRDHRSRKKWFEPRVLKLIGSAFKDFSLEFGLDRTDFISLAHATVRKLASNVVIVVGFSQFDHVDGLLRVRPMTEIALRRYEEVILKLYRILGPGGP